MDSINSVCYILDIGSQTLKIIEKINEYAYTVLWNGPAGYFENKKFASGTNSIAKKEFIDLKGKKVIVLGGGDTAAEEAKKWS